MTAIRQIQSRKQIISHLLYIYQIQPSITVHYTSETSLKVSRFIYTTDQPDEIILKTDSCQIPKSSKINVSYFFDGFEHFFESRILLFKPANKTLAFIKIHLPAAIRAVNRRNYLRLCPDCNDSIQVTLDFPNHGPLICPVKDISAGGISFLAPSGCNESRIETNMEIKLNLLDNISFSTTATLRNMLRCNNEVRIGAEFSNISKNNKNLITNYIVSRLIENRIALTAKKCSQNPLICLIEDNCKAEVVLDYLNRPYRLIRQNLQSDWRLLSRVTPDALLFNLNSISPISLLNQIRDLNNIKKTPAIILADNAIEPTCDATILCGLKDPAMLLEMIECAITPGIITKIQSIRSKRRPPILILDLKGDLSSKVVAAIESQSYAVTVINQLTGILDTIKNIKPVLIVITADIDTTFNNFLRMLEINKHTRTIPLAMLVDPIKMDTTSRIEKYRLNISTLPKNTEPGELVPRLIDIIIPPENDSSNQF